VEIREIVHAVILSVSVLALYQAYLGCILTSKLVSHLHNVSIPVSAARGVCLRLPPTKSRRSFFSIISFVWSKSTLRMRSFLLVRRATEMRAPETVLMKSRTCTSLPKHLYHIRVRRFEFILVRVKFVFVLSYSLLVMSIVLFLFKLFCFAETKKHNL
jgi:hypothetical protein